MNKNPKNTSEALGQNIQRGRIPFLTERRDLSLPSLHEALQQAQGKEDRK
jgi:hypothetical protein